MYILISKLELSSEVLASDRREMKALVDRLRKKFKVSVLSYNPKGYGNTIIVSLLGHSEHKLSQTLDEVAEYCEFSGFGRIDSETTFLDDIENLFSLDPVN